MMVSLSRINRILLFLANRLILLKKILLYPIMIYCQLKYGIRNRI
jgi:hypothetical protein